MTIDAKPEGDVLAKLLKNKKVPLAFECGFDCSCSTCAVTVKSLDDFNTLSKTQPQSEEELNVLRTEGKLGKYIIILGFVGLD